MNKDKCIYIYIYIRLKIVQKPKNKRASTYEEGVQ